LLRRSAFSPSSLAVATLLAAGPIPCSSVVEAQGGDAENGNDRRNGGPAAALALDQRANDGIKVSLVHEGPFFRMQMQAMTTF
jgi:hypothetical protein